MADGYSDSNPSAGPKDDDKNSRGKRALRAAGSSLSSSGQSMMESSREDSSFRPVSYRKGGKIRKTGVKNLHRGERVIPKSKVKRVDKMMRRAKMRKRSSRG